MGAAMVNAWLATTDAAVDAWIPVGMLVPFAAPPHEPVLDVIAEHDFPEAIAAAKVRSANLARDGCSGPLVVPGADHYFERAATGLAAAVAPFIARALAGECK